MSEPRKVYIPGEKLEATVLLTDHASNMVVAVAVENSIVVVFFGKDKKPGAKLMSHDQARAFADEIARAHQAFSDDAEIAQMEKGFNETD